MTRRRRKSGDSEKTRGTEENGDEKAKDKGAGIGAVEVAEVNSPERCSKFCGVFGCSLGLAAD
eukprot:7697104-Prorocentrum_lima.AAC.1